MTQRIYQKDICDLVKAGAATEEIDAMIQRHLVDWGLDYTVADWRLDNSKLLITTAMSDVADLYKMVSALIKLHSGIPDVEAAGQEEVTAIAQAMVVIENKFPSVVPNVEAISILLTRPPGWNSTLGWKAVFTLSDPEYVPANLALTIYTSGGCVGYLYTPGALQYDEVEGQYFAICPPGQEKGDVDYHFGLVYGAEQLSCWTFPAGVEELSLPIYNSAPA
jgi:hypothetical protein